MTDLRPASGRQPTQKAKQREATKARLLAAARRLFTRHGYDDTSVTEISREAGVTHALISVYFNGKAGILYEILTQQNLEQIARSRAAEAAPGDTLARVMRLLEIWAEHDLRDPRLLSVMLAYSWQWPNATEQNNRAQLDQALAPLRRILAKGIAAGELRRDLDVDALIAVIFAIYTQGLRPAIFDAADAAHCLGQMRTRLELVFTGART